ncbi:hypothetical protein D3C86_1411910 [compost metagenome]
MQRPAFLLGEGHADQQAEPGHAVLLVEAPQQDQRIGLGRRLVVDHQQRLAGRLQHARHAETDARCGVDQQHIRQLRQLAEGADQASQLLRTRLGHRARRGRTGDHLHAARPAEQGIGQTAAPGQDVLQRVARGQTERGIDVGQGETGIQQHHPPPARRQRPGEIDRRLGLADTALAAGDGDHLHIAQAHTRSHRLAAH